MDWVIVKLTFWRQEAIYKKNLQLVGFCILTQKIPFLSIPVDKCHLPLLLCWIKSYSEVPLKLFSNTPTNISVILLYPNYICGGNNDTDQVPAALFSLLSLLSTFWIHNCFCGELKEDGKYEISISPVYRTTEQYLIRVI